MAEKKSAPKGLMLRATPEMRVVPKRGTPLYFQTEVFTADVVSDLVDAGLGMGASLIELPNDITEEQIRAPRLQAQRKLLVKKSSNKGRALTP